MSAIWDFIMAVIRAIFGGNASGGSFKCPMFYPLKLCGTNANPSWAGNRGVDSNQGYASNHGQSWENESRLNAYKWTQAMKGNAQMFIAERLWGHDVPHLELQMFLTNRASPVDGHRMGDSENQIVIARKYGVTKWIVSLINNPDSTIPVNGRQDYVAQMCECFQWATADEVVFLVGLECDRNMSVQEVRQMVNFLRMYGGGKRIAVGSADAGFLKACSGDGVELWVESDQHPFEVNMSNAPTYIQKLKDLQRYGKVWAGEFGNPNDIETCRYITKEAAKLGVDYGCGDWR